MSEIDPEDDPFACSLCGVYLSESKRLSKDDYCDDCSREHSTNYVRCEACGARVEEQHADAVDVSLEDEYYPTFIYFCPAHPTGQEVA